MNEVIRQLRSEARQLAQGKAPTAIRYPIAFRPTVTLLTRPQRERRVRRNGCAPSRSWRPRGLTGDPGVRRKRQGSRQSLETAPQSRRTAGGGQT